MDVHITGYSTKFLICISVLALMRWLWGRRRLYYHAANVPGPLAFPFIGSAYTLLGRTQNILSNFMKLVTKYQPLFKIWLGPKLIFVVTKPDYLEKVLNSALEKDKSYKFLIPSFGNGLLTSSVKQWRRHRKIIGLTFNQQILNSFVDIFVEYSNTLVMKLKEGFGDECRDIFPLLSQCTLDIVCDTTMGIKVDAMTNRSRYILWTSRQSELSIIRAFNIFLHPDFIWTRTSLSKESRNISEKIHYFVKNIVDAKKHRRNETLSESRLKKKIFLDHLVELTNNDKSWTDEELIAETQTIIVAGSDSTALTLGHVLMMLGMHQEIQNSVYAEIHSIFGNSRRNVTLEDLPKLEYLDRVIKETLRLFPIGAIIGRQLDKDIVLDNHRLPEGSSVYIPIISVHRDPAIWNDPLKFDPDRFISNEMADRHLYAYIPFSGGSRNCIGYRYAMLALKTVLSTVLRYYKVAQTGYDSVADIELKFDVATKCVDGQKVQLEFRQENI